MSVMTPPDPDGAGVCVCVERVTVGRYTVNDNYLGRVDTCQWIEIATHDELPELIRPTEARL